MQALLGGEMQGLLSVSDLCLLVMHFHNLVCPTPPNWGRGTRWWRFVH